MGFSIICIDSLYIIEPNIGLSNDVCNFVTFTVTNDVCADNENVIQVLIADRENLIEAQISSDF